ncbi:tetraspanin-8-like [Chaetodon trifascialis]|uniref:tetraspanin-8-like n=1 Tax=Chaetodon trifascialis TaxID=109706 RepID=UPI0039969AAF
MGKVNVCLKRAFIVVTGLIAILSALLLALTLLSHGHLDEAEMEQMNAGLHVMYALSIVTLLLTILGVYGACKEKQWPLIVFTVGIILGSLFMIACVIRILVVQPKLVKEMKSYYLDMLPLSNSSESFLDVLVYVQSELQCCGVDQGYLDWGFNISLSCLCTEESTNPCVAAPRNSSLFQFMVSDQPVMIYKEPCLPYLIQDEVISVKVALGITLGVILLWVLAAALGVVILCRMSQKDDTPAVVYSPEAKAGNYTVLTDAAEYT